MQDSKFWRIAAVLMIAAALYVGHGLHNDRNGGVPSLVNTAHAGGVTVSTNLGTQKIYTTSPDGKALYSWQDDGGGRPRFVAMASTDSNGGAARKQAMDRHERDEFKPRALPKTNVTP